MKTPQELKLPKKFKAWRMGQGELIEKITNSPAVVFLLDAPTGTGKSLIGIGVHQSRVLSNKAVLARLSGKPVSSYDRKCVYVTRTKQLQDQVLTEFPAARTIKGRNNYVCLKHKKEFPEFTAEDCTRVGDSCPDCPYLLDKKETLRSPVAVLNISYFLAETNGPGQFRDADLVVIDEVDSLENELLNHIQMRVTTKQLSRLGLGLPDDPHSLQGWLVWADQVSDTLSHSIKALSSQLRLINEDEWTDIEITMHKQANRLENFRDKLAMFASDVNDSWLFSEEENTENQETIWTFKPVKVDAYAERYFWRHGRRFLGMSGTILDPEIMVSDLGITDWEYDRTTSPFPVANRPIYYQPVVNLNYKNQDTEMPKLALAIGKIIERYPNDKILIHTTSFRIRDYLQWNLDSTRVMTHSTGNRTQMLSLFKGTLDPMIMLSPSFDRGVDLPDDLCRCVIICKVPYISLGDPQVKARMKMPGGERWYLLKAVQTIVQMSGRGVRSETDFCDTYILDRQFGSLLNRMRQYFPQWWLDAIK